MVRQLIANHGVDGAALHISRSITDYQIALDFDKVGSIPYHVFRYFAANNQLEQLFRNVYPCTLKFEKQQEEGLKYDDSIIGTNVPPFCMRIDDWQRMSRRTQYRFYSDPGFAVIYNGTTYYVSKDWSDFGKIHSIATFALFLFQETDGEYFIHFDESGEGPAYSLAHDGVRNF